MSGSEGHEPGHDWVCECGYNYFGGSAAYSWQLYEAHLHPRIITEARLHSYGPSRDGLGEILSPPTE